MGHGGRLGERDNLERGLRLLNDDTHSDVHPRGQGGWHRITRAWLSIRKMVGLIMQYTEIKNYRLCPLLCARTLCLAVNT